MLRPLGLALRSASANGCGGVIKAEIKSRPDRDVKPDRQRWPTLPAANVRSADTRVARSGGAIRGRSFPMAMTGIVKFFNGERGYGFIKPDDGGRDVFVHITAVERAGLKDLSGRTAHYVRGRTGQEGQRPQGGQSGDFIVADARVGRGLNFWLANCAGHYTRQERCCAWRRRAMQGKKIPAACGRREMISVSFFVLRTDSSRRRGSSRTGIRLTRL